MIAWGLVCGLIGCGAERAPGDPPRPPAARDAAPTPDAPRAAHPLAERLGRSGPFTEEIAPGLVVSVLSPRDVPDPGFSRPPADALVGTDPRLVVVTIDPARYDLRYHSVLDPGGGPSRAAPDWAEARGLAVAWNPGMFEPDGHATGHTRAGPLLTQPGVRGNALYRAWFVAEAGRVAVIDQAPPAGSGAYRPVDALPAAFAARIAAADLVVQSLPVLLEGRAAYPPRKNQWSELAFGVDHQGRIVVVFSRWPYEMRELGARIAALGLDLDGLLHGEGGPEATLVVRVGGEAFTWVGSYETGFSDDSNREAWALPAILGVVPKP